MTTPSPESDQSALNDDARSDTRRRSRHQFRREPRRELRYHLSIAIAKSISWSLWLTPRALRHWLTDRLAATFFRSSRTYRENVLANLRQVMPASTSNDELYTAARTVFRTSAHNFLDLILIPRLSKRQFTARVTHLEGGWHFLDEVLTEGRGAVIVSAHLGAFDFIGQTLAAQGYPLTTVTGRTVSRFVFDGVTYLRGARGNKLVEPTPSGVRRVVHALRQGECAAFVTDRDFFQNGHPVVFFDRLTTLPPGAVRIARNTGSPIVPIFTRRLSNGYAMTINPAIRIERTDDIATDLDRGMALMVSVLQDAIAACPEQWVMFQRVWREEAVDPVRVFPVGSPLESELLERFAAALPARRGGSHAPPAEGADPEARPTNRKARRRRPKR